MKSCLCFQAVSKTLFVSFMAIFSCKMQTLLICPNKVINRIHYWDFLYMSEQEAVSYVNNAAISCCFSACHCSAVFLCSKLWSGRNWETDPGGGARSWGSPLFPARVHPPGRLPPGGSLPAHHHLLLPEEQLGGSATEGNTLRLMVWSQIYIVKAASGHIEHLWVLSV